MIGQELGGRYEILDRIGGGGMALVYKGHDLLLHRKVAIKVLRQQFVHDDEFIRRFRREAQSAASLSHPNVVSIYDVGQEDDIHYIVMEYVEGSTLNDLIKEKAPLQVEEAVNIACQICDALDHAHSNQIIHRDIKPHNILIGKNGRVKVTDFGIARAATSSTITQTGSVVGSVHYFSPEHAKGTMAGAKSDLYSLGIVLYQMLTGRLPFLGESPISVALKHLQEDVEDPRKVNPLIPQSVENIILKAMRKNPDERYQSAKEMLADLESCLLPSRLSEPKLTFAEPLPHDDEEQTRIVPAIKPDMYPAQTRAKRSAEDDEIPVKRKKRAWVKPVVWLAVLLITVVGLWFFVQSVLAKLDPKDVMIPNVEGENIERAKNDLSSAGLNYSIIQEFNDKVDKDVVISQQPSGMKVKEGSSIQLRVSRGVEKQAMQDFKGRFIKDVRDQLLSAGFKPEQIVTNEVFSKDGAKDTVLDQVPKAGDSYDPTQVTFTFTVSKGPEQITMPDLTGLTVSSVKATLTAKGLTIKDENIEYQPNFAQPKDHVFKQWPYDKGDGVDPGAQDIHITVSSGPPANAGQYTGTYPLQPVKEGQMTNWRIVVTDARYENFEKTLQSAKTENVPVTVTVTPDKNATIQIFRDDKFYDTKTVTYKDYQNQTAKPGTSPGSSPVPSPSPGATPAVSGQALNTPPASTAPGTPQPTNQSGGR